MYKLESRRRTSSPARSLAGRLDLVPAPFRELWIPETVYQEVTVAGLGRTGADTLANEHWAAHVRASPEPDRLLIAELDPGEASVLSLARASASCMVIIDEKRGRKLARQVSCGECHSLSPLIVR